MFCIYDKGKVGETPTSELGFKFSLYNPLSTIKHNTHSKYHYDDSAVQTMASSSKGKQTLEDHYASLSIQNDDEVVADLPFGELNTDDAESFMLVGTLITEKIVKFNFLKETLSAVWRPGKGVVAKEVATNLFIFYFFHEKDRRRVMENSP